MLSRLRSAVRSASLAVLLAAAASCTSCGGTAVTPRSDAPIGGAPIATTEATQNLREADLAERNLRQAVAQDPQSAQAQLDLGNALVRSGKLAEAEAAYRAALNLDPRLAAAHTNLGVALYQQQKLEQAAEQFTAALTLDPNDAQSTYLLAVVRIQESNLTEAERLLGRARELAPDLPEVYYGLGVLYRLQNRPAEAIAAFEKFLEVGPGQDKAAMDYAREELRALQGK